MKQLLAILISALFLTLSGCAAHKQDIKDVTYSGFLSDYSMLEPGDDTQAVLVYRNPQLNAAAYDKILLEPIVVFYHQDAEYKGIHPDELKELTDYFTQELRTALSGYTLVDSAAPGTLRFRIALTDLKPANPVSGTMTSLIPVGMAITAASKVATGEHTSIGETAIEIEVLDAVTNERLAAAVDRRAGAKGPFRGKYKDAQEAFTYWSELIKQRLDELYGK